MKSKKKSKKNKPKKSVKSSKTEKSVTSLPAATFRYTVELVSNDPKQSYLAKVKTAIKNFFKGNKS